MLSNDYLMLRSARGRVSQHAQLCCSSPFAALVDFLTASLRREDEEVWQRAFSDETKR
jgi:hypothetical protein